MTMSTAMLMSILAYGGAVFNEVQDCIAVRLIAIATDESVDRRHRIDAMFRLGSIGNRRAFEFMADRVCSLTLGPFAPTEVAPLYESVPCFYGLVYERGGKERYSILAAEAVFKALQSPRTKLELQLYADVLSSVLRRPVDRPGLGLENAIRAGGKELDRATTKVQRDNLIQLLAILDKSVK